MSLFRRHGDVTYADLSNDLRDAALDWKPDVLRAFDYPTDVTCVACLPGLFLAIGTSHGSIYVFGRAGVETRLDLSKSEHIPIRFLQFAPQSFQLVCADAGCQLHVFDLATYGKPKNISNTLYPYQINSMSLSPSHNHVFVGLDHTSDIRTFDLQCLRKSSYTIPNLWKAHLKKLASSGITADLPNAANSTVLDVVLHPRDLTLVFVVYTGGVVMYNLVEHATVHVYELELIPGAPGGAGYHSKDILTLRRPGVTSLSVHSTGHFFAVGHDDGCIAFWAVEDEDQPIHVRTVDDVDVNRIDADQLDQHMSAPNPPQDSPPREPIFKVAWSGLSNSTDPRGGETSLAILGGLSPSDHGMTTFWLPPFNPPEPTEPSQSSSLTSYWRDAILTSLSPLKTYFYPLAAVPQEFFLVPKDTLHFSGTRDPIAVIFVLEMPDNARVTKAFEYPPPVFTADTELHDETNSGGDLQDDLAATLQALSINSDARVLRLPSSLWQPSCGLIGGQILSIEADQYTGLQELVRSSRQDIPLKGGFAWSDETRANELKFSKYQPSRLLITTHRDLTVQFHDLSAPLLVGLKPKPINYDYPHPLTDLTINLESLLGDISVAKKLSSSISGIDAVHFSAEAQELAIVLLTGEIAVYRVPSNIVSPPSQDSPLNPELVLLTGVPPGESAFDPFFLLCPGKGKAVACALCDVGFLAAGFADGTLLVVDMRGPSIILKSGGPGARDKRQSVFQIHSAKAPDVVASLTWSICATATDPQLRLRLLVVHQSSSATLFTVAKGGSNAWSATPDPAAKVESVAHPLPQGSFVFDLKSGKAITASRSLFARTLNGTGGVQPASCAWLSVGQKGAKCVAGLTGDRIGKVDWSLKAGGSVVQAQIIERLGSHSLVLFTDHNEVLAYSIPHLELLYKQQSPIPTNSNVSIDSSGDMISYTRTPNLTTCNYGTLFNFRRAHELPDIDLSTSRPSSTAQPPPVSMGPTSYVGSWVNHFTDTSITGAQMDVILGGPDRPIITPIVPRTPSKVVESGAAAVAQSAQTTQESLYDRLSSAVGERGQKLGDLEESLSSLQSGAQSMASQAKRLAVEQAARNRFGF